MVSWIIPVYSPGSTSFFTPSTVMVSVFPEAPATVPPARMVSLVSQQGPVTFHTPPAATVTMTPLLTGGAGVWVILDSSSRFPLVIWVRPSR